MAAPFRLMLSRVCLNFRNIAITERSSARYISTNNFPLQFRITQVVCGEPLKKKKRIDPAIIKKREERKRKKIEKSIKRLEKSAKKLKPLDECEIPKNILMELIERRRPIKKLSVEEEEKRTKLLKMWHQYKTKQFYDELYMLDRIMSAQENALLELKHVSEELYQAALHIDPNFIPFVAKGPTATPPIKKYEPPNGIYIDKTNRFDKRVLPPLKLKSVKRK